jgi:hypothetical protein
VKLFCCAVTEVLPKNIIMEGSYASFNRENKEIEHAGSFNHKCRKLMYKKFYDHM